MVKFKYVDTLRGLAILAVLMVHCSQYGSPGLPVGFQNILNNGVVGVQLFYVASAFTLFLSLHNRSVKGEESTKNFFIRRFFRIAPMYYIGIAYYLFQEGFGARYWLGDQPEITNWNILSNIFFFHGLNPYWINSLVAGGWSIAVEVLFYCLVPFLFMRIRNLDQSLIFFVAVLCFSMIYNFVFKEYSLITDNRLWQHYVTLSFPSQLPVFACGIILYFLVISPDEKLAIKPALLLSISLLVVLCLSTALGKHLLPSHILFSIVFIAFGYALSLKRFALLVNPVTTYIGQVSFSMYLIHPAALYWMNRFHFVDFIPLSSRYHHIANYSIRFFVLVILTVAISTFFYRVIEVPFQNFAKRFQT